MTLEAESLSDANLSGADLRGAYLSDANLRDANLSGADLRGAYLSDANLRGADLRGAYLSDANLRDANLSGAVHSERTFGIALNCPEEGAFVAFKKCQGRVVKLLIPEDARRSSATTYKCRASKALCLEIEGGLTEIPSDRDSNFIYRTGQVVEVEDFDDNRWNECSAGVHFFMSREMARQWS